MSTYPLPPPPASTHPNKLSTHHLSPTIYLNPHLLTHKNCPHTPIHPKYSSTHPHPPIKNVHAPPFTQNIPLPTNQGKSICDEIKLKLSHSRTHTYLHDHRSGDSSNTPSLWGTSHEPYRSEESSCIFCLMVCI